MENTELNEKKSSQIATSTNLQVFQDKKTEKKANQIQNFYELSSITKKYIHINKNPLKDNQFFKQQISEGYTQFKQYKNLVRDRPFVKTFPAKDETYLIIQKYKGLDDPENTYDYTVISHQTQKGTILNQIVIEHLEKRIHIQMISDMQLIIYIKSNTKNTSQIICWNFIDKIIYSHKFTRGNVVFTFPDSKLICLIFSKPDRMYGIQYYKYPLKQTDTPIHQYQLPAPKNSCYKYLYPINTHSRIAFLKARPDNKSINIPIKCIICDLDGYKKYTQVIKFQNVNPLRISGYYQYQIASLYQIKKGILFMQIIRYRQDANQMRILMTWNYQEGYYLIQLEKYDIKCYYNFTLLQNENAFLPIGNYPLKQKPEINFNILHPQTYKFIGQIKLQKKHSQDLTKYYLNSIQNMIYPRHKPDTCIRQITPIVNQDENPEFIVCLQIHTINTIRCYLFIKLLRLIQLYRWGWGWERNLIMIF